MRTKASTKSTATKTTIRKKAGSARRESPKGPIAVGDVMTPFPHSVGKDQSLDFAHKVMRKYAIRHLPVLEGGKLVGILSQRDLYLVETLKNVDSAETMVEEAMSSEVFRVARGDKLAAVVATMQKRKYGCAVVMEGQDVVGVFTTIDALRVLAAALG